MTSAPNASATVAFVPRETVSATLASLDTLLARTPPPYDLVAVVAGYPENVRRGVRDRVEAAGGTLIDLPSYATPNEARNAALAAAKGDYTAFVDHDVFVAEGWLAALVRCAVETGAAIVGPLTFEGRPMFDRIHMMGGEAKVVRQAGRNRYVEVHHHAHEAVGRLAEPPTRRRTDLVEFHAALVETAWLHGAGGLDPDLLSLSEHWDMCIAAKADGREIWVEPASRVTYAPPGRLSREDARWFSVRWSDEWNDRSIERLARKHGIAADDGSLDGLRRFARDHRRHRFAPLRGRLAGFVGRRAARLLVHGIAQPLVELCERPRVRRDLARWRERMP